MYPHPSHTHTHTHCKVTHAYPPHSKNPSIQPSIHPSTHPSILPPIRPPIHPSIIFPFQPSSSSSASGVFSCIVSASASISLAAAEKLGIDLAHKLIEDGASPILNAAKAQAEAGIREQAAIKAAKAANGANGEAAAKKTDSEVTKS